MIDHLYDECFPESVILGIYLKNTGADICESSETESCAAAGPDLNKLEQNDGNAAV